MAVRKRDVSRARVQALLADPGVSAEVKAEAEEVLGQLNELHELNPLQGFFPHSKPQADFLGAQTPIQAAFAGNRFGKTTSMVVKSLCQVVPAELLPEHLLAVRYQGFKREQAPPPTFGRVVVPDLTSTLEGVLLPAFRKWTPRQCLKGGAFDRAWDKQRRMLNFADGSWIQCMTYEMDLDKFGGAALHFVCYDEPPPRDIRSECRFRLIDYAGFEMFAMTPLMGLGWIYRDIWKLRESSRITVVRASIHDNKTLDDASKAAALADVTDEERRSREFGEFAHFGGMVYGSGFEQRLVDPPDPVQVRKLDVVVGIDPGMRNAAFVWVGFDQEQNAFVFHEELLNDRTPADYRRAIFRANKFWGVRQPFYVIDPSAGNRSLVNARSVQAELQDLGIPTVKGQNQVEAGVQQVRRRLQFKKLFVSRACRMLRDEAEEYRLEDRPDGDFKIVKERDHLLDALRYALMARPWAGHDPSFRKRPLGFTPDYEGPYVPSGEPGNPQSSPMGALS